MIETALRLNSITHSENIIKLEIREIKHPL